MKDDYELLVKEGIKILEEMDALLSYVNMRLGDNQGLDCLGSEFVGP